MSETPEDSNDEALPNGIIIDRRIGKPPISSQLNEDYMEVDENAEDESDENEDEEDEVESEIDLQDVFDDEAMGQTSDTALESGEACTVYGKRALKREVSFRE